MLVCDSLCTAEQVGVSRTFFFARKTTQDNGPSLFSLSTSNDTFMVSAVSLNFLEDRSYHRSKPASKSCAAFTAVQAALLVIMNGLLLAAESEMVSYKQVGFVRSLCSVYKIFVSDVRDLERSDGVNVAATECETVKAARLLSPEQKSSFLLPNLKSHFSQPVDLLVELSARTFFTGVACLTVPCHRVFVGCERDLKLLPCGERSYTETVRENCCTCWNERSSF